jgi:hypothetical protein
MMRITKVARILMSALREIFDEAAYTRFLQRAHTESSAAAYAAFCRERANQKPRPRCC